MLINEPTYRLPWRVEYWRRCPEWHEKSNPFIVDADDKTVVEMFQHVGHQGEYDLIADTMAHAIVDAMNKPQEGD
jgi:hypothetical protein